MISLNIDGLSISAGRKILIGALLALGVLRGASSPNVSAQEDSSNVSASATIHGRVLNSAGNPVPGAQVHLQQGGALRAEAVADAKGEYKISGLAAGTYELTAEKASVRSRVAKLTLSSIHDHPQVDLPLAGGKLEPASAMEFADNPNFAVGRRYRLDRPHGRLHGSRHQPAHQ